MISLVDVICVVYLDDIFIFSEDLTKHETIVQEVLNRFCTYRLYVNIKKCVFDTDSVKFLDFIVGLIKIEIDLSRVGAIRDWLEPTSIQEL